MRRGHLTLALLVPILATGCLGRTSQHAAPPPATTTGTTTTASGERMSLTVFRVAGGQLTAQSVQVPKTEATAAASLKALGLDADVTISDGAATVDLPDATAEQVAEIVYTLTQYPSVQRVDIGGKTVTRADVDQSLVPAIAIESPAAGARVAKTFHVTGTAMVFEATFMLELRVGGQVAVKQTVTASEGAPSRGAFDVALTAPSLGPAEVVAYEPSAQDGSPLHTVHVPITIAP